MPRPKKVISKSDDVLISLKLGDEVFKSKGTTVIEALTALPSPEHVFLKGILTITKGDKQSELVLSVPRVKRLFYKVARPVLAKQYELILK